jgi:hypothetical protein
MPVRKLNERPTVIICGIISYEKTSRFCVGNMCAKLEGHDNERSTFQEVLLLSHAVVVSWKRIVYMLPQMSLRPRLNIPVSWETECLL